MNIPISDHHLAFIFDNKYLPAWLNISQSNDIKYYSVKFWHSAASGLPEFLDYVAPLGDNLKLNCLINDDQIVFADKVCQAIASFIRDGNNYLIKENRTIMEIWIQLLIWGYIERLI